MNFSICHFMSISWPWFKCMLFSLPFSTTQRYLLPQRRQYFKGPLELARTKVDADVDDQHSELIRKIYQNMTWMCHRMSPVLLRCLKQWGGVLVLSFVGLSGKPRSWENDRTWNMNVKLRVWVLTLMIPRLPFSEISCHAAHNGLALHKLERHASQQLYHITCHTWCILWIDLNKCIVWFFRINYTISYDCWLYLHTLLYSLRHLHLLFHDWVLDTMRRVAAQTFIESLEPWDAMEVFPHSLLVIAFSTCHAGHVHRRQYWTSNHWGGRGALEALREIYDRWAYIAVCQSFVSSPGNFHITSQSIGHSSSCIQVALRKVHWFNAQQWFGTCSRTNQWNCNGAAPKSKNFWCNTM